MQDCGVLGTCYGNGTGGTKPVMGSDKSAEFVADSTEKSVDVSGVAVSLKKSTSAEDKEEAGGNFNDPDKKEAAAPQAKTGHGFLRRGMSNFSAGSFTSKSSMKSSQSGSSKGSRATGGGGIAKRWSMMLDATPLGDAAKFLGVTLREDERQVTFQPDCNYGISYPASVNDARGGHPNKIRTTKFTWVTWLPLSLINQFKRIANIYFLFIACLVIWPWSPKNWKSKIFPFVGVLLWTACKDLYEDLRRKRDDDAENTQTCHRLKRSATGAQEGFEEVTWAEVLCGDVVLIREDDAFPADLVLMHPAGGTEAFISTVMLDGETSLKMRQPPSMLEVMSAKMAKNSPGDWQEVQSITKGEFPSEKLMTQMTRFVEGTRRPGVEWKYSAPTPVLSDVRGTVQPIGNEDAELVCPFTEDNFLPRGCILRNTPFVLAIAIYVGDSTKTRLNASTSKLKFSNMQTNLNNCIRGQLVFLFSLCILATIISFADQGGLAVDLDDLPRKEAKNPVIRFFMFCITFYHVVPMSLYVMYEMLKLVLAFRVNTDKQMYDPLRKEFAKARTADIIEEVGQVNFLFSDKTGTLTANEMVFARCHVGSSDLGDFRKTSEGGPGRGMMKAREVLSSNAESDTQQQQLVDPLYQSVLNFFTCLAVCHSVQVTQRIPEEGEAAKAEPDRDVAFSGMSPDEVALVEAAHNVGITFFRRVRKKTGNSSEVILKGPGKSERAFTVLYELAFTSDRKRMSVVAKHKGAVYLITKGADSVMEGLLAAPFTEACAKDLSLFSRQGLRTLIVGMRVIDEKEFEEWNLAYTNARNIIDETKEQKMAEVAAKLEKDLKFIGVTAVEDRLQDGVPEAIETIKAAGIRTWVLTGDKTETAVDIARSCKLFTDTTTMAYATQATSAKDAEDRLLKAHSVLDGKADTGLVLDGQTLLHAMNSTECRKIIYDLGVVSRSCICSRLSPMQKLELVQLVREQNRMAITLAIGDGANDVPMIQGAHLGIAIRGKEGTQAVQASDIAISYFRFLVPLLLCHGRRAYRRVALFLEFYLYKNVALLMCDVIWMFQDKFRAQIAFPEYLSIGFNVFYSTWHILFVLGFDVDVSDEVANGRPSLYKVGPERKLFNIRIFGLWMLMGVIQGAVAWIVPFSMIGTHDYDKTQPMQFWVCSTVAFTTINIIVWIKLILYSESPCKMTTTLSTAGAVLLYFFCVFCLAYTPPGKAFQPSMWHIPGDVLSDSKNLVACIAAVGIALVPDVFVLLAERLFFPSQLSLAKRGK